MIILVGALVIFYSQVIRPSSSSRGFSLEAAEELHKKKKESNSFPLGAISHEFESTAESTTKTTKWKDSLSSSAFEKPMTLEELRNQNRGPNSSRRQHYERLKRKRKNKMKREKRKAAKNQHNKKGTTGTATTTRHDTTGAIGVRTTNNNQNTVSAKSALFPGTTYRYSTKDNDNHTTTTPNYSEVERIKAKYANHSSRFCLTNECIQEIAKDVARAFPDRTNKEEWCIPKGTYLKNSTKTSSSSNHRKHKGLILVKVPKAASSTSAGVVLRLGHRNTCDLPYVHWGHQHAHKEYAHRDRQNSFMLLSIRDPAAQLVSNVFWTVVTLRKVPPHKVTEDFLTRRAMSFATNLGVTKHHQGGLQLQFASLSKIPYHSAWDYRTHDLIHPEGIVARVKAIIDGYDFMLVVERMDESLVALALILNVPVSDVIVTSSKVSTSTTSTTTTDKQQQQQQQQSYVYSYRTADCLPVRSTFVPPLLDEYLKSDYFRSQAYGDLLLSAAANLSLDKTIERLGVQRFQEAMKEYQYWKQKEKEECSDKIQFPCSSNAKPQLDEAKHNCYDGDLGCGHKCFDKIVAQHKYSPQ